MFRTLLKSKIHRARVTQADLHYEGSITLDQNLMKAAALHEHEFVHIWDITNGNRFETYVIPGTKGSGTVQINGAAAHLVKKNDLVIIASFVSVDEKKLKKHQPKIVFVNHQNKIVKETRKSGQKL
ncbi:MAG: aspartate 1-decarboxylase [Deltaproteobacteria bacterium]|nr:aspartate 1-decarboxylase [Deltaproteobacteria bacterium]